MHGTWLKVPEERRLVERHARDRGERVIHCDTHDDMCECASNTMVRTIVTDLDAWPPGGAYEVARRLAERPDPIVLHAMHRLTPRAIDELRVLARTDVDVRPAYRPYHSLGDTLEDHPVTALPCATMAILRRLVRLLGDDVATVVVASIVLGERDVTERSLARALAISERALRAWLHMAKLPPYGELIRTIRVAHALYRMDVLGLSSAAAAHGAGLGGARSLENTVRRYTGRTPRQLIAAGGFDRYVCQIEEWFACRRRNVD